MGALRSVAACRSTGVLRVRDSDGHTSASRFKLRQARAGHIPGAGRNRHRHRTGAADGFCYDGGTSFAASRSFACGCLAATGGRGDLTAAATRLVAGTPQNTSRAGPAQGSARDGESGLVKSGRKRCPVPLRVGATKMMIFHEVGREKAPAIVGPPREQQLYSQAARRPSSASRPDVAPRLSSPERAAPESEPRGCRSARPHIPCCTRLDLRADCSIPTQPHRSRSELGTLSLSRRDPLASLERHPAVEVTAACRYRGAFWIRCATLVWVRARIRWPVRVGRYAFGAEAEKPATLRFGSSEAELRCHSASRSHRRGRRRPVRSSSRDLERPPRARLAGRLERDDLGWGPPTLVPAFPHDLSRRDDDSRRRRVVGWAGARARARLGARSICFAMRRGVSSRKATAMPPR